MSNVNTMTDPVAHNATTGGSIVMSFAAPTHQSANVNFNCNVQGTSGATVGEFSVYQCDSFTGGTSAPLTQTKVNTTDPETPQGTWLTWAGGQPTPVNPVLLDRKLPLWKFHVFEGLAPGANGRRRVALYSQLHHAAVDGQAHRVQAQQGRIQRHVGGDNRAVTQGGRHDEARLPDP